MKFNLVYTHKEQFAKLSKLWKVFYMDELNFNLFLSNDALGNFEQLYCRRHFQIFIYLFISEKKGWQFMQIVSLHEMSKPVFWAT